MRAQQGPRDVERELRDFADIPLAEPERLETIAARASQRQRGRRQRVALASLGCLILVVGGLIVAALGRDSDREVIATGADPSRATGIEDRRWAALPTSPLGAREDFLVAASGSHLYAIGGRDPDSGAHLSDGAVLDVASGEWQRLPDVPSEAPVAAIDANNDYVVVATQEQPTPAPIQIALHKPTADLWEPVALSGAEMTFPLGLALVDEDAVVATAGTPEAEASLGLTAGLSLSGATPTVTPAPIGVNEGAFLPVGEELLLIGSMSGASERGSVTAAVRSPSNGEWRTVDAPDLERGSIGGSSTSDMTYVWSAGLLATNDVALSAWSEPAEIPWPAQDCFQRGAATEEGLVLWRCDQRGLFFRALDRTWTELPEPPREMMEPVVSTDQGIVLWALDDAGSLQPWLLESD